MAYLIRTSFIANWRINAQSSTTKFESIEIANGRVRLLNFGKLAKPKPFGPASVPIIDKTETDDLTTLKLIL